MGVMVPGGGICSSNGFTHLQSLYAASCFTFHYIKLWRLHSMCMSLGEASAAAASARVAVLGCLPCGMGSVEGKGCMMSALQMKMTSAAQLGCCSGLRCQVSHYCGLEHMHHDCRVHIAV